jgi:chromosome segregation ATPase
MKSWILDKSSKVDKLEKKIEDKVKSIFNLEKIIDDVKKLIDCTDYSIVIEKLQESINILEMQLAELRIQIENTQDKCKHSFEDVSDDRDNFSYYVCSKCNMPKNRSNQ